MVNIENGNVAATKTTLLEPHKNFERASGDGAFLAHMTPLPGSPILNVSAGHVAMPDTRPEPQKPLPKGDAIEPPSANKDVIVSAPLAIEMPVAKPQGIGGTIVPESGLDVSLHSSSTNSFPSDKAAPLAVATVSASSSENSEPSRTEGSFSSGPVRVLVADAPRPPAPGHPTRENAFQFRTSKPLLNAPLMDADERETVRSNDVEQQGTLGTAPKDALPIKDQPKIPLGRAYSQDGSQSAALAYRPLGAQPVHPADHVAKMPNLLPRTVAPPFALFADAVTASPIATPVSAAYLTEAIDFTAVPQSALPEVRPASSSADERRPAANEVGRVSNEPQKPSLEPEESLQLDAGGFADMASPTASGAGPEPIAATKPLHVVPNVGFGIPVPVPVPVLGPDPGSDPDPGQTTIKTNFPPPQELHIRDQESLSLQYVFDGSSTVPTVATESIPAENEILQFAKREPAFASFGQNYPVQRPLLQKYQNTILNNTKPDKSGNGETHQIVALPATETITRVMPVIGLPPTASTNSASDQPGGAATLSDFKANPSVWIAPEMNVFSTFKKSVATPKSFGAVSQNENFASGSLAQIAVATSEGTGATKPVLAAEQIEPLERLPKQPVEALSLAPMVRQENLKAGVDHPNLPVVAPLKLPTPIESETAPTKFADSDSKDVPRMETRRSVSNVEKIPYGDAVFIPHAKSGTASQAVAHAVPTTAFVSIPVPVSALPQHMKTLFSAEKPASLELSLSPEDLGKLRLVFTPEGDKLRIVIQAERSETLELLRRNIESFSADLRQAGYAGTSFSFAGWGQSPPSRPNPKHENAAHPFGNADETLANPMPNPSLIKRSGLDLRV